MTDKEQIEHTIKMADLAKYPLIAYVNPKEPQEVRDKIMETGYVKKVVENAGVELGKVIFVQRTVFEFINPPEPHEPNFENTTTCNECCGDMVKRTVEEQIKHDQESLVKTIEKLQGKENAKR